MASSRNASAAVRRLTIEYKQLINDPNTLFPAVGPISEDNYLEWEALLPGPEDTPFEGGVFSARLSFPPTYPLEPPTMRFDPPIFHPNAHTTVYSDGLVCISILHAAGDDPNMYESSAERWSPVQSVEKILLSVLSMLAEPNVESGANIDACKLFRDNHAAYEKAIRRQVQQQLGL
ncbi:E2 ubiquitin-conjugating enzyme [Malassezia sp. CBS 17886]|nr:E2 ubiquitin-conjugating enzyme [Malassezia sp. CBS 17886]